MRIYFNGCTHSIGSPKAIPDWRTQSYPAIIAKKLGLTLEEQLTKEITDKDVQVAAIRGGSNERIYRKTIQDCIQNDFNYDVVVIQWTHIDRFETPQKTKHKWHQSWIDPEGWMQHKAKTSLFSTRDEIFIPDRGFYKRHHSGAERKDQEYIGKMTRKLCGQIIGLNHFLLSHNIKTLNISADRLRGKMGRYCLNSFEWVFDPMNDWCEETLLSHGFLREGEFVGPGSEIDGHYKEDAHEFIADIILKNINGSKQMIKLDQEGWAKYRLLFNEWYLQQTNPDIHRASEIYEEDWD